jgi:hypothetical protein
MMLIRSVSHLMVYMMYDSKQEDVYQDTAYDLVQSVFQGYNGTIFANGQTGGVFFQRRVQI